MFCKSSSTGAIFPQKVASLRFQTLQQKGRKIQVFRCVLKNWLQIIATVGLEKPTYFKFNTGHKLRGLSVTNSPNTG